MLRRMLPLPWTSLPLVAKEVVDGRNLTFDTKVSR